jgi:hypothetical protein
MLYFFLIVSAIILYTNFKKLFEYSNYLQKTDIPQSLRTDIIEDIDTRLLRVVVIMLVDIVAYAVFL